MPTQMRIALLALALTGAATWWSGGGDALNPSPGGESTVVQAKDLPTSSLASIGPRGNWAESPLGHTFSNLPCLPLSRMEGTDQDSQKRPFDNVGTRW